MSLRTYSTWGHWPPAISSHHCSSNSRLAERWLSTGKACFGAANRGRAIGRLGRGAGGILFEQGRHLAPSSEMREGEYIGAVVEEQIAQFDVTGVVCKADRRGVVRTFADVAARAGSEQGGVTEP